MIGEYALEPNMVATWGDRANYRYYIREFGSGQGRLVSRYPKIWVKQVWEAFADGSDMDKARLTELLTRLKETMVKRKDYIWKENTTWIDNAVQEHARYPFRAILVANNLSGQPEILSEEELATAPCPGWDTPHGITVARKANEMSAAVRDLLCCCRWVKFVDPYFVQGKIGHKNSLSAFMKILAAEKPVGLPVSIEMHTSGTGATTDHLKEYYEKIIPTGLQVTLYRWQERPSGQKLHNRYILTDLGGVSFHHGLDTGRDGETDDLSRLDLEQYILHCSQYDPAAPAFDEAAPPLTMTGIFDG